MSSTNVKYEPSPDVIMDQEIITIDDESRKTETVNFATTSNIHNNNRKPRFLPRHDNNKNKNNNNNTKKIPENCMKKSSSFHDDYIKIFMNPDSQEVQDMLQNQNFSK
jgi:hypothetical protein